MLEESRAASDGYMMPTEREAGGSWLAAEACVREGHTHPNGDDASFGVFHERDEPHVYERKVSVDVLGNLSLVHLGITVQRGVCFVDYIEYFRPPSAFTYFFGAFEFAYTQVIAFGTHLRHAEIFVHVRLMVLVGYAYLALHPVHLFGITKAVHVNWIIRIVVCCGHRAQLVIAAGEHAFRIHVRKP